MMFYLLLTATMLVGAVTAALLWRAVREQKKALMADYRRSHGLDLSDEDRAAWIRAKHHEPCCPTCNGTGVDGDPQTSGQCWDCQGTGCAHA